MNNTRGQVLVLFILLIPLLLLIGVFAIDYGNNYYELRKLNTLTKEALKYGLKNITNSEIREEIINYIYQNDQKIDDYQLVIKSNELSLTITKAASRIGSGVFATKPYYLKATYYGTIKEGKLLIEKRSPHEV